MFDASNFFQSEFATMFCEGFGWLVLVWLVDFICLFWVLFWFVCGFVCLGFVFFLESVTKIFTSFQILKMLT